MSMNLSDAHLAVAGLIDHKRQGCRGEWQVARVLHPSSEAVARLVISCPGCDAGHLFDVRPLQPVLFNANPERRTPSEPSRPALRLVQP